MSVPLTTRHLTVVDFPAVRAKASGRVRDIACEVPAMPARRFAGRPIGRLAF